MLAQLSAKLLCSISGELCRIGCNTGVLEQRYHAELKPFWGEFAGACVWFVLRRYVKRIICMLALYAREMKHLKPGQQNS